MANDNNRMPETIPSELIKARFFGTGRDGSESSNALETPEEQQQLYQSAGAIQPPLDPLALANLIDMSGALRSNIEAYTVNIDSFGHMFDPVIDLDAEGAREKIALAMVQERLLGLSPGGDSVSDIIEQLSKVTESDAQDDPGALPEPTEEDVTARMASIRREMIRERLAVEKFFQYAVLDTSFEELRMKTRHDTEGVGNAYWEVLRNGDNQVVQFDHVTSHTIRLMPLEDRPTEIDINVRATLITSAVEKAQKRFRKFVQISPSGGQTKALVWFKEFGDPRLYSAATGREYKTIEQMHKVEKGARPATEIIHFKVHSPKSACGLPRWVSELLSVVGSRNADEVNLSYFENKSVPPMVIMVSGGSFSKDTVTRLENYVANEIRGKRNYHKIMVLEAESAAVATPGLSTGTTKIDVQPLTSAQNGDAQFMEYKSSNTDAIGQVFRLPRLLRGDTRDFNRATAQTALEFTEQQVFSPLRKAFDYFINRKLLPELGINYWTFRSKGPDFSDPTKMLEAVNASAMAGYLTPEELRKLAGKGFGVDFPRIDADWMTRPMPLTLGGITTGQSAPEDASASSDTGNVDPNTGNDTSTPEVPDQETLKE